MPEATPNPTTDVAAGGHGSVLKKPFVHSLMQAAVDGGTLARAFRSPTTMLSNAAPGPTHHEPRPSPSCLQARTCGLSCLARTWIQCNYTRMDSHWQ